MPSQLDADLALRLAEKLHSIRNAPLKDATIEATADALIDMCRGIELDGRHWTPREQAEWLVCEARHEWEEWQGPRALCIMFESKFQPRPEYRERGRAVSCLRCNDSGVVTEGMPGCDAAV